MMGLPLPNIIPDTQPGGGLVTAMGGINALHNAMLLRKINEIKSQYAPLTAQAEAASKLAYANLMGPQFLAKIMGNNSALGNLSEEQKKNALQKIYQAGSGQGVNQLSQAEPTYSGVGQPSTNAHSNFLMNSLKKLFGVKPSKNALKYANDGYDNSSNPNVSAEGPGVIDSGNPFVGEKGRKTPNVGQAVYGDDSDANYEQWRSNPEVKQALDSVPSTYAENAGKYEGTLKQGAEAGKYRAKAQQEIGDSQLGLSHSGAVLNRMTDIVKNPVFQDMRSKVPFFQDKQLNYLMKTGTPEQKKLIGDFLSTAESFIASTVQGFSGKPLVREFDLAQRQKINPSDPVHVAEGKLRSAIALHDIAQEKNDIISDLLDKGVNLSDAVKLANKKVDISAIEERTNELLRDKPTEEDIAYMAEKHGMSINDVKKQLKEKGIL